MTMRSVLSRPGLLCLARLLGVVIAAAVFLSAVPQPSGAREYFYIRAWNYYQHPPYYYGEEQGLAHDFVGLMNSLAGEGYRFELNNLPRKRLDQYLEFGEPGIVLFVNWIWMGDGDRTRYFWSRPFLADRNEILSNADAPIDYHGVQSLYGKRLGGVPGRKYPGIDEAVARGEISRQDSPSTELNLEKLLMQRIDFLTAPSSILRNLVREHKCEDRVHYSPEPLTRFTRHIMVPRHMPDAYAEVERILDRLLVSPEWGRLKEKYLVD